MNCRRCTYLGAYGKKKAEGIPGLTNARKTEAKREIRKWMVNRM